MGGVGPLFAYGGLLNLAGSVPFDQCTGDRDKDNEGEQGECSGLRNTDQRMAKVIYNRGVDITAEFDGPDGWQGELRGVEG